MVKAVFTVLHINKEKLEQELSDYSIFYKPRAKYKFIGQKQYSIIPNCQ